MGKTARVEARLEPELKQAVEAVFSKLGISSGEAIRMFYQQVELHQDVPFEIRIPNGKTREAIRDAEKGHDLTRYETLDDFKKSLEL